MKSLKPLMRRLDDDKKLPEEIEGKLVTITDFLLSMPSKDRNDFLNAYVVPEVGKAIGDYYRKRVEIESAEVEAVLQTKRSKAMTEQAKKAIPQIMAFIGEALKDIDAVYESVEFAPDSPTKEIWDIVRVIASTRVINVSYSAYDGIGEAFDGALDMIQRMLEVYKQKILNSEPNAPRLE